MLIKHYLLYYNLQMKFIIVQQYANMMDIAEVTQHIKMNLSMIWFKTTFNIYPSNTDFYENYYESFTHNKAKYYV
jgi:hypothetical protein